jgi:GAF domain-containing protein
MRLFGSPAWGVEWSGIADTEEPRGGPWVTDATPASVPWSAPDLRRPWRPVSPLIDKSLAAAIQAPDRVAAVRRLRPLYLSRSSTFYRLTRLAAGLLSAPIAVLTLVDADRQLFLSSWGLPEPFRSARQTALEYSICQYVVAAGRPLILNDTSRDARLAGHLAVTELGIVAYAGMPIMTGDGYVTGTFAAMDFTTRDWTDDMLAVLANLANIATDEIARGELAVRAGGTAPAWTSEDLDPSSS